jgi:hypothetical protein
VRVTLFDGEWPLARLSPVDRIGPADSRFTRIYAIAYVIKSFISLSCNIA